MAAMAASAGSLDFILSALGNRGMTRSHDLLERLVREGSRTDCVPCSSLVPLSLSWDQPHSGCPPVGIRSAYVPSPACALSDLICTMGPSIGPLIPALLCLVALPPCVLLRGQFLSAPRAPAPEADVSLSCLLWGRGI